MRSDDTIAEEVGCKVDVVKAIRKRLEEQGQIERRDKPRTKKSDVHKDEVGVEVPSELYDTFGDRWLANAANEVEEAVRTLRRIRLAVETHHRDYPWLLTNQIINWLKTAEQESVQAAENMLAARPYAVCQQCGGKGCSPKDRANHCHRSGYLPKWRYEEVKAVPVAPAVPAMA